GGFRDLPTGERTSSLHRCPQTRVRFPTTCTLPQQRCLGAISSEQPSRRLVPPIQSADETGTAGDQLVAVVNRRMVRARLSHIQRRSQPTKNLWTSRQVVAVHARFQPGGVEVFRPPAHAGVAAVTEIG